MFKVVTFYKFVSLPHFRDLRAPILDFCRSREILGTILLAEEGINATVAGIPENIDAMLEFLCAMPEFSNLTHKASRASAMPFNRMRVRLKKEIVTMKAAVDPNNLVGRYVPAKDWNDFITRDDVIVVDTRNDYECEIGTFANATNPRTKIFSEFPAFAEKELADKKDVPIAMFCTGGIRCEKATSFLLQQGFKNVYHLEGGILKYLEEIPPEQSLWRGECFVFDRREALTIGLKNRKK